MCSCFDALGQVVEIESDEWYCTGCSDCHLVDVFKIMEIESDEWYCTGCSDCHLVDVFKIMEIESD